MMATDVILTPHLPREVLLLAFFLKKKVGTEDCNLANWGCLSSTGTLWYIVIHKQIMQQQVLWKVLLNVCILFYFNFFLSEHCRGSWLCSCNLCVTLILDYCSILEKGRCPPGALQRLCLPGCSKGWGIMGRKMREYNNSTCRTFFKIKFFQSKFHDFRTSILKCCLNTSEESIDSD